MFTDGIYWARVLRDEAHLTSNWDTRIYRILEGLAYSGCVPPNLVALTATPMLRNGVEDMVAYIRIVNLYSPHISQHRLCAEFSRAGILDRLVSAYRDLRHKQTTHQPLRPRQRQCVAEEIGRLVAVYCIRRRNTSVQNGKALAHIPPLTAVDVTCPSPLTESVFVVRDVEHLLRKRLTGLSVTNQSRGDSGRADEGPTWDLETLLDNALVARILATVPDLIWFRQRRDLCWENIKAYKWHLNPKGSPAWSHLERLVAGSGKLQTLRDIIDRLGVDVYDEAEKLVVVSEFPVICLMVLCVRIA